MALLYFIETRSIDVALIKWLSIVYRPIDTTLSANISYFLINMYHTNHFSSPEPKAQVGYYHSASSIFRPSVRHKHSHFNSSVRPYGIHFHTFLLFYFHLFETTKQNSTKLDRKQNLYVLYQIRVIQPIGKVR